jgi:hypothetical protein
MITYSLLGIQLAGLTTSLLFLLALASRRRAARLRRVPATHRGAHPGA